MASDDWRPIETAPKERVGPASYEDHGPYLLLGLGKNMHVGCWHWHQNGKTGNWKTSGGVIFPTHWMPLPPPPGGKT